MRYLIKNPEFGCCYNHKILKNESGFVRCQYEKGAQLHTVVFELLSVHMGKKPKHMTNSKLQEGMSFYVNACFQVLCVGFLCTYMQIHVIEQ